MAFADDKIFGLVVDLIEEIQMVGLRLIEVEILMTYALFAAVVDYHGTYFTAPNEEHPATFWGCPVKVIPGDKPGWYLCTAHEELND